MCVSALWVDLDPESVTSDELAGWQRAAHQKLMAFRPRPSLVVFSGRGYHGYWLFAEPVRVCDGDDRGRQVVQANKMLERRLDGDSVSDLARVMRVPGTFNPKTNVSCRLLVEDGPTYEFDGLISALDVDMARTDRSADTSGAHTALGAGGMGSVVAAEGTRLPHGRGRPSLGVTVGDLRGLPPWARVLVVGGVWSAKGRYRRPGGLDRSKADLAAVGAMVRAGCSSRACTYAGLITVTRPFCGGSRTTLPARPDPPLTATAVSVISGELLKDSIHVLPQQEPVVSQPRDCLTYPFGVGVGARIALLD